MNPDNPVARFSKTKQALVTALTKMRSARVVRVACAVCIACVLAQTSGCMWWLMWDFDNGREVAVLDIGKLQSVTKTMDLPYFLSGDASLSFVVPDYDCMRPLEGTIDIVIRGAKGMIKQETVNLGKLTWPRGGNGECTPIGYLRLDDENMTRPLKFIVDYEVLPITIELKITQPASLGRLMSVWVVYNDRVPEWRMRGKLTLPPENCSIKRISDKGIGC
ncbi:hypothetical protein AGMMS49960_09100 [Betaproteobacteria bacterium]|nr:hypothetical protein AGMMS49543_07510 [Betaproteobacteria bacterium]GHU00632.1 hypothetical protein AGMMS49960_09100 [Betaproteobacteria bacterium]GHU19694.1 hypothetical protein AGMMS50243_12310 [Betaproteobacteria bacterium]